MLEDYESNLLVEVKFQTSVSNHLMKRMGDKCRQTKHFFARTLCFPFPGMVTPPQKHLMWILASNLTLHIRSKNKHLFVVEQALASYDKQLLRKGCFRGRALQRHQAFFGCEKTPRWSIQPASSQYPNLYRMTQTLKDVFCDMSWQFQWLDFFHIFQPLSVA